MPPKSKEKPATIPANSTPIQNGFSLISNDKLYQLYSKMIECRLLQERLANQFNIDTPAGREAALVGALIDLVPQDTIAPSPGDLIPAFLNGLPLAKLFEILARPTAASPGIAARLTLATDTAQANQLNKTSSITVILSSGKPASVRAWNRAINLAGLHHLPMIFLAWSKTNSAPIRACGFPAIAVDGNDAVAIYRVATESITKARKGLGPTLIHCSGLAAGDPIVNLESYLARKSLSTTELKAAVTARFCLQLEAASKASLKAPV
jgi:TPP-dependent pyruvate/acetoin dehydrogenase alpha subunit